MSCELCRERGHIAFECNSNRSRTIDEAVNHWMSHKLSQYQWNYGRNVIKEKLLEAYHIRRLSKGDFLYLLRDFIYNLNWFQFSIMYSREQYMCFYLGYKIREYMNSIGYTGLNDSTKLRIRADAKYWFNRAYFGQTRADELWTIDLIGYNPPDINLNNIQTDECAVCLRENIERCDMAIFSCGHNFCTGCSNRMMMSITPLRCPLCRVHVNQIIQCN